MNLSFDTRRPNLSSSLTPLGRRSPKRKRWFGKILKLFFFAILLTSALVSYLYFSKNHKLMGELTLYYMNANNRPDLYRQLSLHPELNDSHADFIQIKKMIVSWSTYSKNTQIRVKKALGQMAYEAVFTKDQNAEIVEAGHQAILQAIHPNRVLLDKLNDQVSLETKIWQDLSKE